MKAHWMIALTVIVVLVFALVYQSIQLQQLRAEFAIVDEQREECWNLVTDDGHAPADSIVLVVPHGMIVEEVK